MVLVTFRESNENLTSMFLQVFSSVDEAKQFIEEDAKHYMKQHKLDKIGSFANVLDTDHFEIRNEYGHAILIYQYFII